MEVITKINNNVFYIELFGHITTEASIILDEKKNDLLKHGCDNVLLNLKNTHFISSYGIRTLLSLKKNLELLGSDLKLYNLSTEVEDSFKLMGMYDIFNIYNTEEDALSEDKEGLK